MEDKFTWEWFMDNDGERFKKIKTIKEYKKYLDEFVRNNQDLLNNLTLIGDSDVGFLYSIIECLDDMIKDGHDETILFQSAYVKVYMENRRILS